MFTLPMANLTTHTSKPRTRYPSSVWTVHGPRHLLSRPVAMGRRDWAGRRATRHMLSVCGVLCRVWRENSTRTRTEPYCTATPYSLKLECTYSSSHHLPPPSPPRPAPRVSAWSSLRHSLVSALFLSSLVRPQGASIPSRHSCGIPPSTALPSPIL